MARYFTLAEAERLLPEIEPTIRRAVALKAEYVEAESEFDRATQRIALMGGSLVSQQRLLATKARREAAATALKGALERIQGFGCQVKDLDMGLIDFPTLYRGREVLLCWRIGEAGIQFWHGLEEGFQGRRPVDDEFRANHKGGQGG